MDRLKAKTTSQYFHRYETSRSDGSVITTKRRGGTVVECTALEMRLTRKGIVGYPALAFDEGICVFSTGQTRGKAYQHRLPECANVAD